MQAPTPKPFIILMRDMRIDANAVAAAVAVSSSSGSSSNSSSRSHRRLLQEGSLELLLSNPISLHGRPGEVPVVLDFAGAADLLKCAIPQVRAGLLVSRQRARRHTLLQSHSCTHTHTPHPHTQACMPPPAFPTHTPHAHPTVQNRRIQLTRLFLAGLARAPPAAEADVSPAALGNLTSSLWAFSFRRRSVVLQLENITMHLPEVEVRASLLECVRSVRECVYVCVCVCLCMRRRVHRA